MKKIFTHLFAVLLLSLVTTSAWAQTTTDVELNFTEGTCNTSSTYCSAWTSTTTPSVTISVDGGNNNLVVSPSSNSFEMHEGSNGCTYRITVNGHRIVSYSFTYKTKQSGNNVTIEANGSTYTSSDTEQSLEVTGLDSPAASFSLSGSNTGMIVANFVLKVYEHPSLTSLEEGQVYMFENARAARSLSADGTNDVHTKTTDAADTKQQWYVTKDGDYYVLRNLATGKYLKGASTSGNDWVMTDDYSATENKFELHTSNYETLNTLKTKDSDDKGYMHDDNNSDNGGYNIKGWYNGDSNTGSHWTITKVEYTDEQITEFLEKAPTVAETAAYKTNTEALFTDKACLTPAYGTLAEAQATEYYKNLSAGLKEMVDKIYNDAWAEDNADATKHEEGLDWDAKYAKKFRVQMYEPYSIAGDITSWLGINAHANNDNPTGIYVPEAGTLYVMVEGEVKKDGATLRLVDGGSNGRITNAASAGYALEPGLNIINYTAATGMLYICYNVDTYNPDGTDDATRFPHKLSEYAPLKIHIEGGAINGFYNAQGDFRASAQGASDDLWYTMSGASVDCDADWEYMETRANLSVLPVLGHRQVLLFQLEDTDGNSGMKTLLPETVVVPDKPYSRTEKWSDLGVGISDDAPEDYQVNVMMESWDRIMYSELATMGVLSEDDINKMNNLYPRWKSDDTYAEIYDLTNTSDLDGQTYLQFCNGVDYSEYFNHHGVAFGTVSGYMYGGWDHCGYHINTFGSIVSKLSSEAGPTWGPGHEIGHQHQGIFNLNGQTEVTNNMFANIAVWYMGMGTSRYNGSDGSLSSVLGAFNTENNDAYTNNIWALTHMYYRLWLYYHLAGNNTQFMPRLFELCRRERLQNGTVISGDQSMLLFYKHACDAAGEDLTEFFRAHGYLEVMEDRLVGDYTSAVYTQTQEMVDEAIAYVKNKWSEQNYAIILINDGTSETTLQHNGTDSRALWDGNPSAELGSVTDFIDGEVSVGDYTATYNSDGSVTMTGEGGVGFLVFNEDGELVSFSNKTTFALSDEAMETIMTGNATFVTVDSKGNTVEAEVDLAAMQKEILGTLIAKAQKYVDLIGDTYTKIGYYKEAALAGLKAALESAQTVYAGSSGYEAAYDLLYAELKKVEANPDAKIPFDPSLTYIITNYAYPSRTMTLVNGVVYANTNVDLSADAAKWQFKETSATGVYNVYNCSGTYCGTISGSTAVATTTEQASASNYTIDNLGDGLWAISLNPSGTNTQFHAAANDSYKVVGWNTSGNATKWYLTAVEPNATIADLTNLEVYINKTEALLGEVLGSVTYTRGSNIELQTTDEDQPFYIWTNAQCPTEGDIANLVDDDTGNYFHTAWEDVTVSSGDHYIAVDLGEDNTLKRFSFSHTTRIADNDHVKSADVYGSDDNVTYKYLGSASDMPQTGGQSWQYEGVMVASHRYLRFNMHANRGYWHMAEFDIMPVTGFTATVNDTYSITVTVDAVTAAMEALLSGKSVALSMSPTTDDIDKALATLKEEYEALYELYEQTIIKRKETLAQLASETDELILKAGTVTLATETPFELTTSNLYCNEVRTDDCGTGGDTSANGYVSNLTDNNTTTFLHTNYDSGTAVNPPHYLRVDFGDGSTVTKFKFSYTTRDNGNNCPTTIVIEGCDTEDGTYDEIKTLTTANGLPNGSALEFNSSVIPMDKAYRYVRFKVTGVEDGDATFFVMSEFSLTTVTSATADVLDVYESYISDDMLLSSRLVTNSSSAMSTNELVTSVPLLDAQIADQQAVKDKLYAAMNNTAALKENLKKLIDDTQALYDKMATDKGAVNEYYSSTSALTADNLSAALAMITAATEVYNNSSATVDAIGTAYDNLNEKYAILKGIDDAEHTSKDEIAELIDDMQELLGEVTDATTVKTDVALQTTDEGAPFYIWHYQPATDDNGGIANLIDKNSDGSANTGTYTGTYWQGGAVAAYTHYLEIDLGADVALSEFSIDYTTRYSGAEDSRPNGLKFYGSNDKEDYTELFSITEGLPSTENTQWTMAAPRELASYFRYIRIAVSSPHGSCFNMSDFNLYAHSALVANSNYQPAGITGEQLYAMNAALQNGIAANQKYVVEDNYDAALETLRNQYNALLAIKNANVTDKDGLSALKTATDELVTEVAAFDETETELKMQCDDPSAPYYLYCNAPGEKNNYSGDDLGVTALLDNDTNTSNFLHTSYVAGSHYDELDHYLRLDMGGNEALVSFKFSYTGRPNSNGNAPKTMVIEGSNNLEDFEEITTLTDLPTTDATVTYSSDVLGNGKAYRYIRFMVTETKNNAKFDGHPFFALSSFSVTACKTIEVKTEYVSPNLPLGTLVTANNEVVDAGVIVDRFYVTQTAYNAAKDELQAARDALELAKNLKELPVVLTTDASNPVLYKIKINRNGDKRLDFDSSSKMVAVADETLGDKYQAWYFMQGTDDSGYDDIRIFPYWYDGAANTTLMLGTNNISDGNSKVKAVDGSDNAYKTNWYITFTEGSTAANWWNIQPEGKATYFSNHGGVSEKMGFYNDADDDGSEFQFILDETDYSLSDAYYALYNLYNSYGGTKVAGTAIGCYISVDAYNSAYNAAATLIENKNATDEEYIDARTALEAAYAALERRMPVEGGFYRLKSAYTGRYSDGKYIYADAENKLYFSDASDVLSKYIWQFEEVDGGYNVKNLHTDSYIKTAGWGDHVGLSETAGLVTIETLDYELGILRINTTAYPLHAQNSGSKVVGYSGGLNSASAWYIEEVENVEEAFKHTETLSALGYGTLILNYDAKVPDGVTAYVADGVNGFDIIMTPVADDIIPANTAVILQKDNIDGNALDMQFKYSTAASGSYDSNMLRGTLYTKVVKCDTDDVNNNIYMMQNKNGAVKMYWMYENYNANGERVQVDGSYNHDEGGYVRCTANRAYLVVPQNTAQGAAAYSFRFTGPTTGIDEVNADSGAEKVIYDLQGRKLSEITEPGIYIVNGKKIYVK